MADEDGRDVFVSTYEGAIDAKGRVSVPAPFRSTLGGGSRIFLWPALGGLGCLEGGGEELMAVYQQTISRLAPHSKRRRMLTAAIISRAADLKMDDPGRIKVPEPLLDAVGITDRLIWVGAMDSFQIWAPDAYEAFLTEVDASSEDEAILDALAAPYDDAVAAGGVPGIRRYGEGEM
ncbi:MAG: division/cell wall cluster transcriptional repressor MraZ [Pseudomonadota bacterium]